MIEKQLRYFIKQGKPLKYLINYMLGIEEHDEKNNEYHYKYDEMDALNMMISLGYEENEVISILEYDFGIDMSEYKERK